MQIKYQLFPVLYGESSKIFHFAVAAYYEAIGRYVLFRCRYIPVSLLKMVYHKRTLYLNSWLILYLHSLVEYRALNVKSIRNMFLIVCDH
jgi:hypothetical protein